MDFHPTDTVKLLQQKRRFHEEQLRLIDIALAAIADGKQGGGPLPSQNGEKANKVKQHRIRWTREIERFLDDYEEVTIMDLQSDLAQKRDIPSALTIQGRNVITNTLNRFEKKGRVQKVRPGVYTVIKESLPS
ncbi:MAG: hypothetical protein PVG78_18930 [Desulfobacterales bacterium]|jgi:hypothetical protein